MNNPVCDKIEPSDTANCIHYIDGGTCKLPMYFKCIEYIRNVELTHSVSSMVKHDVCPFSYYLSKIRGLYKLEKDIKPSLGSAWARLMAKLHAKYETDYHNLIGDERFNHWKADTEGYYPMELEKLFIVLKVYMDSGLGNDEMLTEVKWETDSYPRMKGYVDAMSLDRKVGWEDKYTGVPERYTKFIMKPQIGIYLLYNPTLDTMVLRTIRSPAFYQGKKETRDAFLARLEKDIRKRLHYYFNLTTYYRSEFDLDGIKRWAESVVDEIAWRLDRGLDSFRQRQAGCNYGGFRCEYLPICENDSHIPEGMYGVIPTVKEEDDEEETSTD